MRTAPAYNRLGPDVPGLVNVGNRLVPTDLYKREGSDKMMAMHDQLSAEHRSLVHEINLNFVWNHRRFPVDVIRRMWRDQ